MPVMKKPVKGVRTFGSHRSPRTQTKKTTCKGKWFFVWQGRLDSNQRNDGVRVRSLTAWRRPYVIKLIYFIKFVFFLQAF